MSQSRNIFQDVSSAQPEAPKPAGKPARSRRGIAVWLMVIFALVVMMIVVGGLTRLTDSGLSITEWKPVTGAIPPLSDADWQEEFAKYQASPEFRLQNMHMDLSAFKGIFWWEWAHRFLGRVIGLVWGVGFLWFWLRKAIPTGWTGRLLGIGVLGGVQGAIGWWMVSSGLSGFAVDVASYRLAIHLGLAFLILGLIAWYLPALRMGATEVIQARRQRLHGLGRLGTVMVVLVFLQVLLGALVAGIDAGQGYTDWPLMQGEFLPSSSFDLEPFWSNFLQNPALVQWNHRMLGYLVALVAVLTWWKSRASALDGVKRWHLVMVLAVAVQVGLGITTVLFAAQAHIAITHQLGAVIIFALTLRARFESAYPAAQKIARA